MSDIKKLIDIVSEKSEIVNETVAGCVASVAMPLGATHKRVEETAPEHPPVLQFGNWENSALTVNKKEKSRRNPAKKTVKESQSNEFVSQSQATKILTKYGAVAVRSRSEDLDFSSSTGEKMSLPMKIVDGAKRVVKIADLNKVVRTLKGVQQKQLSEQELAEQDLIINPAALSKKIRGLVAQGQSRQDHEVEMARSDLFQAAKNAGEIYDLIKDLSEDQGLEGWVQEKIIKASDYLNTVREYLQGKHVEHHDEIAEASTLTVDQLAAISDEALDNAYHYGRSQPGNTFGWKANLKSAEYAKRMIDLGVTDIEKISDAIHKGWNVTAKAFVQNPEQFDDTEKLKASGKLQAKLEQRAKLMKQNYADLPDDEQEKDRVVARALLQALTSKQDVAEGSFNPDGSYNTDDDEANEFDDSQPMDEDRTEVKDKSGRVVSWKDNTEWHKEPKKDPRGKVTHLSDVARRQTEKLAKQEKHSEVEEGSLADMRGFFDKYEPTASKEKDLSSYFNDKLSNYLSGELSSDSKQSAVTQRPALVIHRDSVDEGYQVVPDIDRERYTDLSGEGLEGPFRLKSGKIVYYDKRAGKYYDRDTDMYLSHDDYAEHERTASVREGQDTDDFGPEFQEKLKRLGQMAKQGPRKTVWDPVKQVYKTVPVNSQDKQK